MTHDFSMKDVGAAMKEKMAAQTCGFALFSGRRTSL